MTDQNQPPVPPQQPTPPSAPAAPQYQAAPQYNAAPPVGQPGGYGNQPNSTAGKGLGIAGLIAGIAGFFILPIVAPIAGLIMSIIGRNQSRAAGVPNGPAKAGIIVSIISLVLGIIITIVVIVIVVAAAGSIAEACAELGPGTHYIDGITYTCS
ncbi:DUF4190 domain-containing protein [Herbiconiux sp. A18JL235]|uniref:DUF4190 domain-containing protein n=1 Tax=Herbiconiux sp. A18JL235 TaxID=3152363 RepID=A0AB39BGL0_9MICO